MKVIKAKRATGELRDMAEAGVLEVMTLVEDYFWYIMGSMFSVMVGISFWVWKSTPGEFTGWSRKQEGDEDEGEEGDGVVEGNGGDEGEDAESEGKAESDGEDKPVPTLKRRTRVSKQ